MNRSTITKQCRRNIVNEHKGPDFMSVNFNFNLHLKVVIQLWVIVIIEFKRFLSTYC